jgi:hypothetical protein
MQVFQFRRASMKNGCTLPSCAAALKWKRGRQEKMGKAEHFMQVRPCNGSPKIATARIGPKAFQLQKERPKESLIILPEPFSQSDVQSCSELSKGKHVDKKDERESHENQRYRTKSCPQYTTENQCVRISLTYHWRSFHTPCPTPSFSEPVLVSRTKCSPTPTSNA